ncbi:hypothetical protein L505_3676 [Bordetella bronchiseptica F4563]|uniref:hypothetical protein n=1 Tax=Bordetella bronchiseptica TaxID=518 RepID=UPI0004611C09|nr:hypothetical protein [Bordetella bronchiseptica]KDC23888.1 hypothetical protein L505_3676 [Bordetella bronchiseptica F4563]
MTTINDGGPAFPIPLNPGQSYQGHSPCDGMTLRDHFAAKADVSLYGPADALATKLGRMPTMKELAECIAQLRLLEADAMLAARAGHSAVSAAELLAHVQDLLKVFVHDPFDSQQLVDSVVARAEESVARAQLGVYA